MNREIIRVEPPSTYLENWKAPASAVTRYFPKDPPARIFVNVPAWPDHFDIEIDCIATV
ncbi:MAG TPA: RidA family protein [Streptosporangiaceae bacterium]|nr:RidA family protein [Streptosporangiaceae bacterium]